MTIQMHNNIATYLQTADTVIQNGTQQEMPLVTNPAGVDDPILAMAGKHFELICARSNYAEETRSKANDYANTATKSDQKCPRTKNLRNEQPID